MRDRRVEFNADSEEILRENRQLGERFAVAERKKSLLMAESTSIQKELESSTCTNQRAETLYGRFSQVFHAMGDVFTEIQAISSQRTKVEEKTRGILARRGLSDKEIEEVLREK